MDDVSGLTRFPIARRGFFMTGLMSGLTLATTRVEAQVTHTDETGIAAGEVKIPVADGTLPGYVAKPQGAGPFPTVLVIEEIFGVHEYIKDTCRRFAKLGYMAVAPELYARIADLSTYTDASKIVSEVISKAPDATVLSDLDSAAAYANANGGDAGRLFVTGFCRGGRDTWLYGRPQPGTQGRGRLVRPGCRHAKRHSAAQRRRRRNRAEMPRCSACMAGQDTSIKPTDVEAAAARARAAGKTVDIVVYPDAPHGFHADYRPSYRAADAQDGWNRLQAWFKTYGA